MEATERERIFAKLSQEDEEFRRKIVDLHRKLSDVDEGTEEALRGSKERLRELESVARRAEEASSRNAERMGAEGMRGEAEEYEEVGDGWKDRRGESQQERWRHMELLRRRSRKLEEEADERSDGNPGGTTEKNFLNRLRIKKRSMKLLSFLSGKSADRSQEERAARLLRMYLPEKGGKAQNTISIHHTSRDRRFWKLRSRRRSSST
ncbi:hypothetical protein KM043_001646 [Ampulex compressa]|nr:hypothetical protein KM043_001646 [Ampulex compressa]